MREMRAKGNCQARVILTEEDLALFFVLEKLEIYCGESRLLVVNDYHIDVTAGIYRKLVRNGRC